MKKLLLFVLAAVAFAACEQAPIEEQSAIRQEASETITVGFEGDDDTRIQLNEAQKTVWTKGDLVSVFYRSNANQQWKYDGETGARTAELKRVDAGTATRDMDRVVVVYPYNKDYYINPSTYNVQASLPAVQNYLKDSYGTNGNIMISSSEYNQFSLKSVCGWLKLQLTGDGETIKSIKFRGNDGEQVAGELYINSADATAALASDMGDADDNNAGGSLVFDDTILTEVTLDCGEGVELLPVVTSFYIAIPPQTFEKGFTVEITDNSNYTMVQSTRKKQVIERNHIQPMAAFEFINPSTPATPKPANNEIWYTATEQIEPIWDDAETFGANLKLNTWDSTSGKGVYTFAGDVTMVGTGAFSGCKLKSITLPESVKEIGSNAFRNCDNLKDITFGNSVEIIKERAFYYCDALEQITISNSITTIENEAFCECDALTSVLIGDGLTKIGDNVFAGCDKLKEFKGKYASDDCRALVMDGVLLTYADASGSEYVVPNYVTSIYHDAFKNCKKLTKITISDSVINIGESAFYDCAALATVNIGNSVIKIEKNAFYSCNNITEFTLGSDVQEIGDNAFRECTKLPSITLPENVILIGYDAFKGCTSLKKIYSLAIVPPVLKISTAGYGYWPFDDGAEDRRIYVYSECVNVYKRNWSKYSNQIKGNESYTGSETTTIYYTTIDGKVAEITNLPIIENTFNGGEGKIVLCGIINKIPSGAFYNCNTISSITIPDSVTSIGEGAFDGCDNLKKFKGNMASSDGRCLIRDNTMIAYAPGSGKEYTIPEDVVCIGSNSFYYCNMTNVIIPNSVKKIETNAFYCCWGLRSIVIPESIETLERRAFEYCYDLERIYFTSATPIWLNDWFYSDLSNSLRIFVPEGSVSVYKNSGQYWGYMADIIFPYDYNRIQTNYEIWYASIDDLVVDPYDAEAFGDAKIVSNNYESGINVITFDREVTEINYDAFYECNNLINISIPDSVTSIGEEAFKYCYSLTSINIGDSVTSIGYAAFCDCTSLTSVTIPDSVTSIGDWAFYWCTSLTSVYCKATTPPSLDGDYVFDDNGSGRKIYVPAASVEAYKGATNWSEYASYVVGYDFENGVVVE